MSDEYTIKLTKTAKQTYIKLHTAAEICLRAGDNSNAKVKAFRMVEEAINVLIPHDPFERSRALTGPLTNLFRIRKGRIRICYIGSSEKREIVILYISETPRKAGDMEDPYELFTNIVLSGRFDKIFDNLGVRPPPRKTDCPVPLVQ